MTDTSTYFGGLVKRMTGLEPATAWEGLMEGRRPLAQSRKGLPVRHLAISRATAMHREKRAELPCAGLAEPYKLAVI